MFLLFTGIRHKFIDWCRSNWVLKEVLFFYEKYWKYFHIYLLKNHSNGSKLRDSNPTIEKKKNDHLSQRFECTIPNIYKRRRNEGFSGLFATSDHMISGINIIFNQETINTIQMIGNVLTLNTPKSVKNECSDCVNSLTEYNYGSETIICNVVIENVYAIISVTSCSCELTFSKLSIVTTNRLDGMLTIFIDQN